MNIFEKNRIDLEVRVFTQLLKDIEAAKEACIFWLTEDLEGEGYLETAESENIVICADLQNEARSSLDELEELAKKYLKEAKSSSEKFQDER